MQPEISVVLEGYNQTRELGVADDTIAALLNQDFPLERIELILVGAPEQVAHWECAYVGKLPFAAVRTLACEDLNYYDLKNSGALLAEGKIIAFTDSDVLPRSGWIGAIVENISAKGADVSIGPTLFGRKDAHDPDSLFMRMAAAVTWGWILGRAGPNGMPVARGFMDHNIAMRREVAAQYAYRTDFGRIIASPLLFRALKNGGKVIASHPEQQAVHAFWVRYWLIGLQFRYGYEVYRLRREDKDYPLGWLRRFGALEPLATLVWHMALDVPKWFRLNRMLQRSPVETVMVLPAYGLVSLAARTCEMLGMYATILCPDRMKTWAQSV